MYKKNNKRIKLKINSLLIVFFSIMMVVSLIKSISVFAEPFALTLSEATITEKSDTVSGNISDVNNNKINDDITFHRVNDDITYKMVIKNNLDKEITILSITDDNENEYITFEYDKHENETLGAGESFDFYVTARYNTSVTDMTKRNQNTSTSLIINYFDGEEENEETIIINPQTGDTIFGSITMFMISSVGLIVCIAFKNKKSNKKKTMIIIVGIMMTSIVVKAATLTLKIELITNYGLYDKQVVTYKINGEEKTLINQYGEIISGLETPNKEGYTFDKWVYEDGTDFDPTKEITSDINLVAKMNAINYSISYDLNGGNVSSANPTEYTIEDTITLTEPTKEHYTFIGWTGTDLTEPTKNIKIESMTGNRSYSANYEPTNYTITYSGLTETEKNALNNPTTYNIESSVITLSNPQNRTDDDGDVDEIFSGWKEGETISTTISIPNNNSLGNKTFEAIWTAASPTTYTITYELNGGTTATANPVEFTKNTDTFTLVNPTKIGYVFKGWSGTDLTGDSNTEVKVTKGTKKNLSFEANYTPINYQVKFEKNASDATGTMPNQTFTYNTSSSLNEVMYSREGYTFAGWNTDSDKNGTHYEDQETISNLTTIKDGVISLYAEWNANSYSIVLNANAPTGSTATGEMADVSMVYDTPKSLPLNMYSVEGYTFDGWNTEADGTGTNISNGGTANNLASTGTVTLYAKWKANTYTVQYNKNGGEGSMSDSSMTYAESKSLTKSTFVREGYTFAGWNTVADGSGAHYDDEEVVNNLTSTNNGIVVLYAEWNANSYSIVLDANAPTGSTAEGNMSNVSMVYDTPKSLPTNSYSILGYTFDGWNTEADGTGTSISNGGTVNNLATSGNITLYAQWAPGSTTYTVIHKKMDLNGTTYTEADRETIPGTTNSEVTPDVNDYYGFTAPSKQTKTVAANGSTTIEYLYTRNKYTLTITDSEYVDVDRSGEYYYEEQVSLTALDREDYIFTGWSNGASTKTITLTISGNITITPTYEYNVYIITLNPNGGGVTPSEIKVTKGEAIGSLPTPVRQFNDFDGWYTSLDFTTEVTAETVPNGDLTYFAKWIPFETPGLLCRKATSLHTTECPSTAACKNAGYTATGSKGTTTVTFGSIPHAELTGGNAFDCDVNSDGIYDEDTERFYYLTTKGNNAVLISHTNYEGFDGQIIVDNFTYDEAITKLPQKISEEWKNARVTFSNPMDNTDTNIYAARFATYDEILEATGASSLTAVGSLDNYAYLMENSQFVGVGRSGIWLVSNPSSNAYYRIHTGTGNRNVTTNATTRNAARPVIEVPLELMDITDSNVNTYTITFESNDGPSVDPINIEENTPIGELPSIAKSGYEFDGWYYESNFATKVKSTDLINEDKTLYAKWNLIATAKINDTYYNTLSDAITAVQTNEEETVVKLLKDTSDTIVIANKKNIVLDLQNNTISNSTDDSVISNNGYLVVKNGTINTDSENTSAINNNSGATIRIIDMNINSTGAKQALYNDNGNAEISGNSNLSNTASNRAAVHNLNNGTLTIKGGRITASGYHAVYNESGTLTIGEAEGVINTTTPVLQGANAGLSLATNKKFNFYDGIIKGVQNAIDTPANLEGKEEGSEIKNDTEEIDGVTYKTAIMYVETSKYKVTFDADGGTVSPAYKVVDIGDSVGELPTPSKGVYTFDGWYSEKTGGIEITSNYTPSANITIYARYHYDANETIDNFNMISDAMQTYYSNLNSWLDNSSTFQTNMDTNFNNYNCSECTGPNYQACPTPSANKTLCEQSKGYAVGINNINVYESNETTKEKGNLVTYTTIKEGTIYNMIPGQTYYWEADDDASVHGYVKANGNRRTIASNVRNVRDLGGLEVDTNNDGIVDGTIKYGKIFRGAKLSSSASDVAELQKLGITEEIDLRGSSGDAKLSNYVGRAITNYLIYPDTYNTNYKTFRAALIATMQDVINGENIYFHCAIGTDRTGTMAYFLEGLLGVGEEDRIQDYETSYFTGLLNRNRFHDYLSGSSINPRFTTMQNTYKTNQSIYEFFMAESTNEETDNQLIEDFRNAMIDYN